MNERIQELAEQAGFYVADGKIYIPSTSEEITTCQKKFAELIVAECMRVVGNPTCPNYAYRAIQKHFGVEE
jgi:putative component of membrane protein insertase Oxa1/YidC/SpoIIIJ protein YidD